MYHAYMGRGSIKERVTQVLSRSSQEDSLFDFEPVFYPRDPVLATQQFLGARAKVLADSNNTDMTGQAACNLIDLALARTQSPFNQYADDPTAIDSAGPLTMGPYYLTGDPEDATDLRRCEITYALAPPHLQQAMDSYMRMWRKNVTGDKRGLDSVEPVSVSTLAAFNVVSD